MDAKRIEQIRKEAVDERQTLRGGDGLSSHFASLCLELLGHVSSLKDWKVQASKVLGGLQLQEIAKEIGLRWGDDIGPAILPWIRNQKAQASKGAMAPHVFAQMVNRVRDLAFDFGTCEQFRDRVSELLEEYIDPDAKARAVVVPPLPKPTGRRADDAPVWGMPEDLADVRRQAGNPVLAAYQAGIRKGHAIAENSARVISANRVLGGGMVAVDRQLLLDIEDALGNAERLGPCGLGLLCQVQDALRTNQEDSHSDPGAFPNG